VVVIDDHAMVRDGLVAALSAETDITVLGFASNLGDGVEVVNRLRPDIAVTDLELGDGRGSELMARLSPDSTTKVVIITGHDDRVGLEAAVDAGCAGFVGKGSGLDHLVRAVRSVAAGASVFPADLLSLVLRRDPSTVAALSEREIEVLQHLAEAKNAEQIAGALFLSLHTVRNHIRSILTKLNASSQLEAVVQGVRTGIITIR
jgi:DNA-binding NarL/FixJ family response regulator